MASPPFVGVNTMSCHCVPPSATLDNVVGVVVGLRGMRLDRGFGLKPASLDDVKGIEVGPLRISRNHGFYFGPPTLDDITGIVISVSGSRRNRLCITHRVPTSLAQAQ